MTRYTKGEAEHIASQYKEAIERSIYEIQKNFKDMDIENNDCKEAIEKCINEMIVDCQNLSSQIDYYRFQ